MFLRWPEWCRRMASCWSRPFWRWDTPHLSLTSCCFTSDNNFFISLSCSPPGHWGRSISEPHGAVCRGALQPKQALFYSAGRVAEGGAAASRLPIVPGNNWTEGKLFKSDSQVTVWLEIPTVKSRDIGVLVFCHICFNAFVLFAISSVMQRTDEQAEDEGNREGVHVTVQRAPWHRIRRRILKLYPWTFTHPQCRTARRHNDNALTNQWRNHDVIVMINPPTQSHNKTWKHFSKDLPLD